LDKLLRKSVLVLQREAEEMIVVDATTAEVVIHAVAKEKAADKQEIETESR
jgi:hypothetical protein